MELSYYLVWREETGEYDCEIEETVYNGDLEKQEDRVERSSMGIDFIPVVPVPTEKLSKRTTGYSELEKND